MSTPMLSSLSNAQRATVEAVETPVTFPRSKDDASDEYFREYRHDCRRLMRLWVAQTLADFDDVFGVSPETEADCLTIVSQAATVELGRVVHYAEARLIATCTTEHVIIKTALRTAAEMRAVMTLLPSSPPKDRAREAANHAAFLAVEIEAEPPVIEEY